VEQKVCCGKGKVELLIYPDPSRTNTLAYRSSLFGIKEEEGKKFYEIEMRLTATKGTEKANKEKSVPHIS
jgi:hypothetical protein